ncbi:MULTISPECIES: hypothetical protein [Priestia]|uniref:hypothetical protein n=1 Tax=Priestia TaxID=2800373 RepID=UPI0011B6A300|nr:MULTISPECIES: hypothetical protein [Priestia]MCG0050908.1 hypothetical protein [Priestia aryabhattai]QDZ88153.1 hypothetical protein D0441_28130 [Priestia megaterium]
MKKTEEHVNNNELYDKKYPELKRESGYTSPASALPLHELKMLQQYIHGVNLQNLGNQLPDYKKHMMLLRFFKHKKNQVVEVYSRNKDENIHTIGKVTVIGRDFVMLKTLFTRIWIPYDSIHSAQSPFGVPDVPSSHQHVIFDEELRRKLLTNFGETVSNKEILRQQFFEELLQTNLKNWKGTRLTIYTDQITKGKVNDITPKKISIKNRKTQTIPFTKINYIKQGRIIAFFQSLFLKFSKKNK